MKNNPLNSAAARVAEFRVKLSVALALTPGHHDSYDGDMKLIDQILQEFQVQEMISSGRHQWDYLLNAFDKNQRYVAADLSAHSWEISALEFSRNDEETQRIESKRFHKA